jgi:hypothetical protein
VQNFDFHKNHREIVPGFFQQCEGSIFEFMRWEFSPEVDLSSVVIINTSAFNYIQTSVPAFRAVSRVVYLDDDGAITIECAIEKKTVMLCCFGESQKTREISEAEMREKYFQFYQIPLSKFIKSYYTIFLIKMTMQAFVGPLYNPEFLKIVLLDQSRNVPQLLQDGKVCGAVIEF